MRRTSIWSEPTPALPASKKRVHVNFTGWSCAVQQAGNGCGTGRGCLARAWPNLAASLAPVLLLLEVMLHEVNLVSQDATDAAKALDELRAFL